MRIWYGIEYEIYRDVPALFIEGNDINIEIVKSLAKEKDVVILYFGAGKREFSNFDAIKSVVGDYTIIIETTDPYQVPEHIKEHCVIVYRIEPCKLKGLKWLGTVIKVEGDAIVLTSFIDNMNKTILDSYKVKERRYKEDILLYGEDEK